MLDGLNLWEKEPGDYNFLDLFVVVERKERAEALRRKAIEELLMTELGNLIEGGITEVVQIAAIYQND